jgi:phage replisome organizer N-terminal domain protein
MAIYNKTELYFFKFPNTFFDKDEIELFEDDPEGDSVIILYLKLITLATNKNGYLCKIIAGEVIPYTTEELCRKTNTSLDDFQRRLRKLKNVGLVVIKDDMLFIEEALNYTNQTVGAKKKQDQRKKKKDKCPPNCPPDIDIEKEIEIDKEIEKEIDKRNKKKESELQPEEDISDEEFNWDDVLNDIGIYKS